MTRQIQPSDVCDLCDHAAIWHTQTMGGLRCDVVESGTTTRGVIGLDYSRRCNCREFMRKAEPLEDGAPS